VVLLLRYLYVDLRRRKMNGSIRVHLNSAKRSAKLLVAAGLFFTFSDMVGQSTAGSATASSPSAKGDTKQAVASNHATGVEILTDTQGVDFGPYIRKALAMIKKNWLPLIPEEARPPANMQGETVIRFSLSPDGKVSAMHLDGSSQHTNMDRAAWGAITGVGQFPSLPTEFKGPHLELRIDFLTNRPLPASAISAPAIP
jgi:TonB family protein